MDKKRKIAKITWIIAIAIIVFIIFLSLRKTPEERLKYGMTTSEVVDLMGKPSNKAKDDGKLTYEYDKGALVLVFNENNKLQTTIGGAEQVAKEASEAMKNKKSKEIGFAQSFGRKPFDKIQKLPGTYKIQEDGNKIIVVWPTGDDLVGALTRVDDTTNNTTTVYSSDNRKLYSGRTIIQRMPSTTNDY